MHTLAADPGALLARTDPISRRPRGERPSSWPGALTARERVVLTLLSEGMTAVAIAHRLGISPRTVHKHLENIYVKLGVSDRLSAVLRVQDSVTTTARRYAHQ